MRLTLLSSAAVALTLLAAPQLASAQSEPANAAQNPNPVTPALPANSPTGGLVNESNTQPSLDSPALNSSAAAAAGASASDAAAPASSAARDVSTTEAAVPSASTSMVTNGPVADTPENRAKSGAPMSNAGKRTAARGN